MLNKFKFIYFFSFVLFFFSLFFPAFSTETGASDSSALILTGWFGFFVDPVAAIPWLANPFYFLVIYRVITKKNSKFTFVASLFSLLLSLYFLGVNSIILDVGGRNKVITYYHAGYYLWLLSLLVMTIGLYIEMKISIAKEN